MKKIAKKAAITGENTILTEEWAGSVKSSDGVGRRADDTGIDSDNRKREQRKNQ